MVAEQHPTLVDGALLRQANSAFARGRLVEARVGFRRAFEEAVDANDAPTMALAALGLGGIWVNERRALDEYTEYRTQLRDTLGALGREHPELAARVAVRLAAEECYAEGAPVDQVRSAVDAVRAFDDPAATCEAMSLLHHLLLGPHDRVERERIASELVLVAARVEAPEHALMGLVWSTVDAFLAGDAEAPRLLARLHVRADDLDHAAIRFLVRLIQLMLQLRAGRIAEVEDALDDAHAQGVEAGEVDAKPWMAGQLLAVRWLQGRQHEVLDAARTLADLPDLTRFNRVYPAVWAAIAAAVGNHDEARVALARVDPFGPPPRGLAQSSMWLVTMFAVVEAIRHLGDTETAQQAYDMLAPFADLPLIASLAIVCLGSAHRSLAWCAIVKGDTERGIVHFRRAIDEDLRIGNLPMLAITRADLASAVAPTDRPAARELLAQAIASGRQFGMTRWVEQWESERNALDDLTTCQEPRGRWCREGRTWEVEVGTTRVLVPDSTGMRILSTLLTSPYRDIPVTALLGAPDSPTRQAVLDERAQDDLRRRVCELQKLMERADALGDSVRSAQLTKELEDITIELAHLLHHGRVSRDFTTPAERARTAVQKAIRRALGRIGEQAPDLAQKLRSAIHTGTYCRFQPDGKLPEHWTTRNTR